MKYWKGYLTAAIFLACGWALTAFAKAHTALMDMIYPYVTRMGQGFLAGWSGGVEFCLWQALLYFIVALVLLSAVLMLLFKWNPIQWTGWVCAVVAVLVFFNTCLFGLNKYSGSLAEDIRLDDTSSGIGALEAAAVYYRDQANTLSEQVSRKGNDVEFGSFEEMSKQAAAGFDNLVYEDSLAVFAVPLDPVKKLGWEKQYARRGVTGVTVGLTGEAAVNPRTPAVMLPFAMCREMAYRGSIGADHDAAFAAYLACINNPDVRFQYSGALMGYRYCLKALEALAEVSGTATLEQLRAGENEYVFRDLQDCNEFLGKKERGDAKAYELLACWHYQEIVLPGLVEEEYNFNPMDKSQVDLSEHPDA